MHPFDIVGPITLFFDVGYSFFAHGYGGELWTTDENGTEKTIFSLFDDVYIDSWVILDDYYTTVPLYIVKDRDWNEGDILDNFDIDILMVKVEKSEDGIFYSKLILRQDNNILEI